MWKIEIVQFEQKFWHNDKETKRKVKRKGKNNWKSISVSHQVRHEMS